MTKENKIIKTKEKTALSAEEFQGEKVAVFMPTLEAADKSGLMALLEQAGASADLFCAYSDAKTQAAQIESAMTNEKYSAFIVWAVSIGEVTEALREAEQRGIIVFAYGEFINTVQLDFFAGFNYKQTGRQQAYYITETAAAADVSPEDGGKVVVIRGQTPNSVKLADGATEVLTDAQWSVGVVEITEEENSDANILKNNVIDAVTDYVSSQGLTREDVYAVCACRDSFAEGVIEALESVWGELPVITGFGCTEEALTYISEGRQSMSVDPCYAALSEATVNALATLLRGEEIVSDDGMDMGGKFTPMVSFDGTRDEDNLSGETDRYTYFILADWDGYEGGHVDHPEERELDHIEIITKSDKTEYYIHEYFDPAGMVVKAYFTDDSEQIVSEAFNYDLRGELKITDSVVTVSVTYRNVTKTDTLFIDVFSRTLTDIDVSTKKIYLHNEEITRKNFTVFANYDKGNARLLGDLKYTIYVGGEELVDYDSIKLTSLGEKTVVVYYNERVDMEHTVTAKKELTVNVVHRLENISVEKLPEKLAYASGDRFIRTGIEVRATYCDGTTELVPLGRLKDSPEVIRFRSGESTAQINLSYEENGIKKETSLTVYSKTGAKEEDCFETQDFGEAGSGKVNLGNGKLRYSFDDYVMPDAIMPITVSHLYKHGETTDCSVGNGWRLNLQQEIVLTEYEKGESKFKYIDKNGKEYIFENGWESENGRAAWRNEELGFDLFIYGGRIKLLDRDCNLLAFTRAIAPNKYLLTEIHQYPSTPEKPIEAYSAKITYSGEKIVCVSGGKSINGNRPTVNFNYDGDLLKSLSYSRGENESVTLVEYSYSGNNLAAVTKKDEYVDKNNSAAINFEYAPDKFVVYNDRIKDADGNKKRLCYEIDGDSRVINVKEGFTSADEDVTNISYYETSYDGKEKIDVTKSAKIEKKGTVSFVTINSLGAVSQCGYEVDDTQADCLLRPYKINNAQSRGFSYDDYARTYSDTLDVCHDNFENDLCGWSGNGISLEKKDEVNISGNACISGHEFNKTYKIESGEIEDDTSVYLSFWLNPNLVEVSGRRSQTDIRIKVKRNSDTVKDIIAKDLSQFWRFEAFDLGKLKVGDLVEVNIESDTKLKNMPFHNGKSYLSDVRLTKRPYEDPEEIYQSEYGTYNDAFGKEVQLCKYNPVNGKITKTVKTYDDKHQLLVSTTTCEGKVISKEEREYNEDGLLVKRREYGIDNENLFREETNVYGKDKTLVSTTSSDGVTTYYADGEVENERYSQTTVKGATDCPDQNKKTYTYAGSSTVGSIDEDGYKNKYEYFTDGNLKRVKHGYSDEKFRSAVDYLYDSFGNVKSVAVDGHELVTTEYDRKHLFKTEYANGFKASYGYDNKDRLNKVFENGDEKVSVTYADKTNDEIVVTDACGVKYTAREVFTDGKTTESIVEFADEIAPVMRTVNLAANAAGNVSVTETYFGKDDASCEKTESIQDEHGRTESITHGGGTVKYSYDALSRRIDKETKTSAKTFNLTYEYDGTTSQVKNEKFKISAETKDAYFYEYYPNGNLKSVSYGNELHNLYTYDEHDRLTSEYNALLGYKYVYEYDCGGNITAKKYYVAKNGVVSSTPEKTDTYSYNDTWKDQLSEINGKVVSYDESGNITGYADKTFVWKGKRVASINGVALEYDYNGLRVLKGSRKYYRQNGNLKAEVWSENGTENRIYYRFDESGVSGFNYNGKEYYYRKNTLGDVLAIYDANGTLQCKYAYDAWGNHKVYAANGSELTDNNAIGNLNPIRYRSYYWDKEFALYYLQSRYYAPELGRFISPDGINYLNPDSVIGLNLYVYCGNNPLMNIDPKGTWSFSEWWGNVTSFISDTFSGFVSSVKQLYKDTRDFLFIGYEEGVIREKIYGDDSKPISFYVQSTNSWLKFWQYQVGVKINFKNFSFSMSFGIGESNYSFSYGRHTLGLKLGIEKIGVEHKQVVNGATTYTQYYLKTWLIALAVGIGVFAPEVAPVVIGALAAA